MIFRFARRSYRMQFLSASLHEQLKALSLETVQKLPPITAENFCVFYATTQAIEFEEGEEVSLEDPTVREMTSDLISLHTKMIEIGTAPTDAQLSKLWELYIDLDEEVIVAWVNAYVESSRQRLLPRAQLDGLLMTPAERERLKDPADPLPSRKP